MTNSTFRKALAAAVVAAGLVAGSALFAQTEIELGAGWLRQHQTSSGGFGPSAGVGEVTSAAAVQALGEGRVRSHLCNLRFALSAAPRSAFLMARPGRMQLPGAVDHAAARGKRRQDGLTTSIHLILKKYARLDEPYL